MFSHLNEYNTLSLISGAKLVDCHVSITIERVAVVATPIQSDLSLLNKARLCGSINGEEFVNTGKSQASCLGLQRLIRAVFIYLYL